MKRFFHLGDSQHSAKQKSGEHVIVVGIAQPHLNLNWNQNTNEKWSNRCLEILTNKIRRKKGNGEDIWSDEQTLTKSYLEEALRVEKGRAVDCAILWWRSKSSSSSSSSCLGFSIATPLSFFIFDWFYALGECMYVRSIWFSLDSWRGRERERGNDVCCSWELTKFCNSSNCFNIFNSNILLVYYYFF